MSDLISFLQLEVFLYFHLGLNILKVISLLLYYLSFSPLKVIYTYQERQAQMKRVNTSTSVNRSSGTGYYNHVLEHLCVKLVANLLLLLLLCILT